MYVAVAVAVTVDVWLWLWLCCVCCVCMQAEDELDWPQCGWACGWQNTSNCPAASMPQESFYRRMFARNRCNMRDFQNIGTVAVPPLSRS